MLQKKIAAEAAKRLAAPTGHPPQLDLARYAAFLKVETHRLRLLHRGGASGIDVSHGRAFVLDELIAYLLAAIQTSVAATEKTPLPTLALVAIGGYGRSELNPHSDIDIMVLHDGDVSVGGRHRACVSALTERLLLSLYDLGLKVGHSVRNVEDCVKVANTDMQSKTSLIEARLIKGEDWLFQKMRMTVESKCVAGYEDDYIGMRLMDQAARRAKYGDSACMQEPNIKNGCGGLRDYQNLLWMAFFKYRVRTLADLQAKEWISEQERHHLEVAYDYLLRVRTDLHYHMNRATDVLLKSVQPAIAHNLGFTDRSPVKRLERFMREVYTHLRHIYLITRTVEERLAILRKPKRRPSLREFFLLKRTQEKPEPVDGFLFVEGEIRPATPRVFRDQPRRLMRVFLHAQQGGLKIPPDLAQLIRNQLTMVDRHFLRDPHVHQTFLEILNQRGNVAPFLRTMHEVGFLGRYLPEFGRMTCLVQHEFFHRYTADEHTLVCLEMLDRVWSAKEAPFNRYTPIFQKLERPSLLYLALLLHDAGKVDPRRKHVRQSSMLATRVAKRMNLDESMTRSLVLLIEQHLAMIDISMRRDLEDPAVAVQFARRIKTLENLDLLLLHTLADTLGTSVDLWNDFKEALVMTLYNQTGQVLMGKSGIIRFEEKEREALAQTVRRMLPKSITEEEWRAHFDNLPARYFLVHQIQDILLDLDLAHRFFATLDDEKSHGHESVVGWTNVPDCGYASIRVCTWDRPGLFSRIAGCLTAVGLSILSAQIFSRTDGLIFDNFAVIDAQTGTLPLREKREQFERILRDVLAGRANLDTLLDKRRNERTFPRYTEVERLPTVLRLDQDTSAIRTIIEVETEDRVGLLYTISHVLSELGMDISTAKICTEKGAAVDAFYVSELQGSKITEPVRLQAVERAIRQAIESLDAPKPMA